MSNLEYITIPGTTSKVYETSLVELTRLPECKWVLRCGRYSYGGVSRKGWYLESASSKEVEPMLAEDLMQLQVIDGPKVPHQSSPAPPSAPLPTPQASDTDGQHLESAIAKVPTLPDKCNPDYLIIPGTTAKVYETSLVELFRFPDRKWMLLCGPYCYDGAAQKGWYFASVSSPEVIPVFSEDLTQMRIIDGPRVICYPSPFPPVPVPTIFTVEDKKMLDSSMITVPTLEDRDKLSGSTLVDGKIVRVNDIDGAVEYYEWDADNLTWIPATLGYRYMTRDEIKQEFGGTIVDILYSDSSGLLTLVKYDDTETEVELTGVAHDVTYENYQIRIPLFGRPDLVVDLARGSGIDSIRIDEHYEIEPGVFVPALVVTEIVEDHPVDIATDVTSLYNQINHVIDSGTIHLNIDSDSSTLRADVKISNIPNNVLNVDSTGLYVDISGKVDKRYVDSGYLLMSDGLGGFTTIGGGVAVKYQGTMDDTSATEVPTSNLIGAAIQAAVTAAELSLQSQIDNLNTRLTSLEDNFIAEGNADEIITSTATGIQRSGFTIGGQILTGQSGLVAREEAVQDAISWKSM